jgi:hypothetical protein
MMKEWVTVLRAADAAARRHVHQRRKGSAQEPNINHLLEVASLVTEAMHIGPESCAVAREGFGEALGSQPGESQGQMGGYAIRTF